MEINNITEIIDVNNEDDVELYKDYLNNCINVLTKITENNKSKFNSSMRENPFNKYITRQKKINDKFNNINEKKFVLIMIKKKY